MAFSKRLLIFMVLVGFSACQANAVDDQQQTAKLYERMFHDGQADVAQLNLFFTRMPKGGDIHHHYTGSIYAETFLDWVKREGWLIDPCTLKIVKQRVDGACASLSVDALLKDDALYRKLLSLWSDKDYANHFHIESAPDSNFFNTFGYFGTVSDEYMADGLKLLKQRALDENVSYIETMLSIVPVKSPTYFSSAQAGNLIHALRAAQTQQETDKLLDRITGTVGGNPAFLHSVNAYLAMVESVHQGIDDDQFTMRFQTYAARVLDPLQVFLSLYSGFVAADKSPLVVGVNIVAPENNAVALADYTLHMRMFNYLHRKYPDVQRALHAGELTLGMVRPRSLQFHIRQALEIAHAGRIGHGVDLPYELGSTDLLAELKKAGTAIEINLTSNQFILGVQGQAHPYLIYSAYGVPLVISTDDSGVSRNNLSNQYMLLASRYHPPYDTIKAYVYNSITYSFLSDSDKASAKRVLNRKFAEFERDMAELAGSLKK